MVVATPNKTIKEEIKDLEFQKQELIKEIDTLEKKLKVTQDIAVKGDITLQCGTQTRIEPQFHLKLDPNVRMGYAGIFAILEIENEINRSSINIMGRTYDFYSPRTGRPLRAVTLWERFGAINLD